MVHVRTFSCAISLKKEVVTRVRPVSYKEKKTQGTERDAPSDGVPGLVAHVEDQILGVRVHRPGEHLLPVFEVAPRLVRSSTGEGREAGPVEEEEWICQQRWMD